MAALQSVWHVGSPPIIKLFLPSSQPTATIRLKLPVKDREGRANPPAPTLLAPPVRVPTGETMPLHPTNPLSGAPWSRPPLLAPRRPLPRVPGARETPRALTSWILVQDARCFQSHHETARSPDTSTTSGESRVLKRAVRWNVNPTWFADVRICDSLCCAMYGKQRQALTLSCSQWHCASHK